MSFSVLTCRLFTLQVQKRGLSAYDDKRFVLGDNVTTLAYGHHNIPADAIVVEEDADVPDFVVVDANIALDVALPAPADAPEQDEDVPIVPANPACWNGREPPHDMVDRVMFAVELVANRADLPLAPNELSDNDFIIVWENARERAARCENLRAYVDDMCAALIADDMDHVIDLLV